MSDSGYRWLTISLLFGLSVACGGDDDLQQCSETDEYRFARMLSYAEVCDASFKSCNPCPPDGICNTGTVEGMALSAEVNTDFANAIVYDSTAAMCTIPCDTDIDCVGLDFVTANGFEETIQQWRCKSVRGRKVCAVFLQLEGVP